MSISTNILILFGFLISAVGCQTVSVSVNSIKNKLDISRETPIVFTKKSDDIEIEKLRRQCMKGAQAAGVNIATDCGSNCYWATIEGQTGASKERTNSVYNAYTKQTQTFSNNVTDRKMKISLFDDIEMKTIIYQSTLDSSGEATNVLSVAEEMCEAAFKIFPQEVTGADLDIESR